jgi:hypothetical protein
LFERKGEVCKYTRRSLRNDIPKNLSFGAKDYKNLTGKASTGKRDMKIKRNVDGYEQE